MASISEHPDAWTWATLEPEPTEHERALYETFCFQYLVDRSATKAASRCGFQAGFAVEYGRILLTKSYVQRRLAELERVKADAKQTREFDQINNMARLRAIASDEMQKGSARVSAVRELNAMHGLHAPTKVDLNANHKGGVMILPTGTMDEWEAEAKASQQALIEASRVD